MARGKYTLKYNVTSRLSVTNCLFSVGHHDTDAVNPVSIGLGLYRSQVARLSKFKEGGAKVRWYFGKQWDTHQSLTDYVNSDKVSKHANQLPNHGIERRKEFG